MGHRPRGRKSQTRLSTHVEVKTWRPQVSCQQGHREPLNQGCVKGLGTWSKLGNLGQAGHPILMGPEWWEED